MSDMCDDIFVTNAEILREGNIKKAGNAIIINTQPDRNLN